MTTLQDVAAAAGVSKSVASRVLTGNDKARIAPETRQRVEAAASRLAYVPDHRARALRTLRSGAMALVVPGVHNAVFSELFAGVQQAATRAGLTVLLGQLEDGQTDAGALARIVGQGRVDGVVLQRREDVDDRMLAAILDVRLPVVLFNSTLRNRMGSVIFEDASAARIATRHLLERGHRHVGFLGGTALHDAARRRAGGFRDTMYAAGLRVDRDWMVPAGWEADAGASGLEELLRARRRPTGVVVASVNAAVGAASRAAQLGFHVPHDLSIVTIQDTWVARLFSPALTVVRLPLRQAGYTAAEMLLHHLAGTPMRDIVITDYPPELVLRQSTAPPNLCRNDPCRPGGAAPIVT